MGMPVISSMSRPNYGDRLEPILNEIIDKLDILIEERNQQVKSPIVVPETDTGQHKNKFQILERIND